MNEPVKKMNDNEEKLVTFYLGEEMYGIDIIAVQEIIRMQEITNVPKTLHYVEGVINLRGKVIPVVDLRKKFNLPSTEETKDTRIIVVEYYSKIIAMIVDSVSKVIQLPGNAIEPPSPIVSNVDSNYMKGIGKIDGNLIVLLDLAKVLGITVPADSTELATA